MRRGPAAPCRSSMREAILLQCSEGCARIRGFRPDFGETALRAAKICVAARICVAAPWPAHHPQVFEMDSTYGLPPRQGLYDPANEHDACGVGFVAHIKGRKSHDIVAKGLTILNNLRHRGATGADPLHG